MQIMQVSLSNVVNNNDVIYLRKRGELFLFNKLWMGTHGNNKKKISALYSKIPGNRLIFERHLLKILKLID